MDSHIHRWQALNCLRYLRAWLCLLWMQKTLEMKFQGNTAVSLSIVRRHHKSSTIKSDNHGWFCLISPTKNLLLEIPKVESLSCMRYLVRMLHPEVWKGRRPCSTVVSTSLWDSNQSQSRPASNLIFFWLNQLLQSLSQRAYQFEASAFVAWTRN